ncbi:T9SS type A sorting domain-containing protein [candidate division KSB1 bacterium]|nr:T9SS type A sorting domain-containing protein [candidate division KSB1 bacterium]
MRRFLHFLICLLILIFVQNLIAENSQKSIKEVTIKDIQYVPDSLLLAGKDDSPFLGDTVTVEGIAMFPVRKIFVGNRWTLFITTPEGGPWSALQIIQDDSMETNTVFSAIETGDRVKFTGIVDEFQANARSSTQIKLLTRPPVPVEFISSGNSLPEPVDLTCADLNSLIEGEKYELALVRIKNATVQGVVGTYMQISDGTGAEVQINTYFNDLYNPVNNGTYKYPQIGTTVNITGYIRDYRNYFYLCPPSPDFIEIQKIPPSITNVTREPVTPTASESVEIRAKIKDSNGTVQNVKLFYRPGNGAYQEVVMTAQNDSFFVGTIPPAADGTLIRYFLWADDNDGEFSTSPGDTAASQYLFTVRDQGTTIYDIQWTPYANGNSPFTGLKVTVTGTVVADSTHFPGRYVIQDDMANPWHGIWVYDPAHRWILGDKVKVSGTIEERYNQTQIAQVADAVLIGKNGLVQPIKVTTGTIATNSPTAEGYEAMLVEVSNMVVTNSFPDAPSNFGEFVVDDGTGEIRVNDLSITFDGNTDSSFVVNDSVKTVRGILSFDFYNYKIEPRNLADVVRKPTGIADASMSISSYHLAQNFPNPFNPRTMIYYQLAQDSPVKLLIYNIKGQQIKKLVDNHQLAGRHSIEWNGTDEANLQVASGVYFMHLIAGDFHKIRKMLLVR